MRALGIFATAPIPGWVKPRLADEVGASTAADVYGRVGRAVVAATATPGHRTIVWYSPSHELGFVREWLGGLGPIELRPQSGGTPGTRLTQAFARHFADRDQPVVIIGTDTPGIELRLIAEAFAALRGHDAVLGPTHGGGCYLVGLATPPPPAAGGGLFRDLAWLAAGTANQVRARMQRLGLTLRVLRPLRAIETARDARALGYLKA
jgi:uncharacterized protein